MGWLRGEKKHCSMAAIPSLEEEDAKRPHREREHLVNKRTSSINRMKAALVRLGIRGFNPKLHKAPQQLATLRTPEGCPIPPNTLAELQREMAHFRFLSDQIKQIEKTRLTQLKQVPRQGVNDKVWQLQQIKGLGLGTSDMLVNEVLWRNLRDQRAVSRYVGLTGWVHPTKAGGAAERKGSPPCPTAQPARSFLTVTVITWKVGRAMKLQFGA